MPDEVWGCPPSNARQIPNEEFRSRKQTTQLKAALSAALWTFQDHLNLLENVWRSSWSPQMEGDVAMDYYDADNADFGMLEDDLAVFYIDFIYLGYILDIEGILDMIEVVHTKRRETRTEDHEFTG
ncbi:hypothetical protein R3P38DRAFT_2781560 [Favolaschia claudopus]|uniref:Uncharacterized protein n=1 Tax=Favolaschia claudopus TaxID=2862362 RepID=A0AAW0B4G2_9AGAR